MKNAWKNDANVCIVISTLHSNSYKNTVIAFWAACLPNWGKVLAPVGQNCWQTHAQYLHFVVLLFLFPGFYQRMQFLSYEFLTSDISKPSRQLADSWITANWLDVRILQQKTRQSDSFFSFLQFFINSGGGNSSTSVGIK